MLYERRWFDLTGGWKEYQCFRLERVSGEFCAWALPVVTGAAALYK
jgi:hypothetical protein